jgi:hypothetical protein
MAPVAGMIKDATKSYDVAFKLAAALLVVGAALTFLVRAPAPEQAPSPAE